MKKYNLLELLEHIDPAFIDYQDWVNVGMALKHEGYSVKDWEQWSQIDFERYHKGECQKKWDSFGGSSNPVTAGTIVQLAKSQGWTPGWKQKESRSLDWGDTIGSDDLVVIDKNWIEKQEVEEPEDWDPVNELIRYLEILFESTENVGYVTESWKKDDKYLPTKGHYDRTAGEIIEELGKCNGDIGAVFGDYNPDVGAWIRFNPLDGKGVKNENVTDYRHALIESDEMDIEEQNAILKQLELPISCLVHSGNKSLHAIVKIDATNYDEYRKRVDYLYDVCKKNGLIIDSQNRNPSRLSRMPGIMRKGQKQFLIDTNIGKQNWHEWYDWIEGVNDDLPNPESLQDVWNNLPKLADPLIDGILRQGHKMLLAGPSKAGKSYALIELCIAVAEGKKWLGWNCAQGRILYVNLELDRASCLHRFKDVYNALGWKPNNLCNIDIWNLRGKSVPMDKLAPKLIRRAHKKEYIAVVIDPIYKVITGDENSADQMAHFTNQFDKVCTELGSAVIYCHHHSKGYQGNKRSMDRASGSGVFARDPDVLLDMTELDLSEEFIQKEISKAKAEIFMDAIKTYTEDQYPNYIDTYVSESDMLSDVIMEKHARRMMKPAEIEAIKKSFKGIDETIGMRTAWRIEGTLREFPKFYPLDVWFDYPIHTLDQEKTLGNLLPESEKAPWMKAAEARKTPEERKEIRANELEIAYHTLLQEGKRATYANLAEQMKLSIQTIKRRIDEHGGYQLIPEAGKETTIAPK